MVDGLIEACDEVLVGDGREEWERTKFERESCADGVMSTVALYCIQSSLNTLQAKGFN